MTATAAVSGKSEATQQKLIAAGIELFARGGYEATSTRQVQEAAGVQRNLITYHFGSKEQFWKRCMAELFGGMSASLAPAIEQSKDIEPMERIRFLIRRFVRASAEHPETVRIMFDEGRCDDWRLDWLVAHYVQPFFGLVEALYEQGGLRRRGFTLMQFYYFLVSSASVFAMAPEYRRLSGDDPFAPEFIDSQANAVAMLLTSGA